MKRALSILLLAFIPLAAFPQNWTTISAANITDLNQQKLAAGQLCFLGTDQTDTPISFNVGGGGQVLKRAFCAAVSSGGVAAFTVPNPSTTSPAGIYYRVTVKDSSTGQEVLRYSQVSFSGATFNFDLYAPVNLGSFAPPSGNSVTGNLSVSGNIAATGTLTASNIPATIPGTGSCANQFVTALNSGAAPTCSTDTLASAQHANQGTVTTVLHGNAAGNPSWGQVALSTDVAGTLPPANGGTGQTTAAAAFNALSPMTTLGDLEYDSAAATASRLAGNITTTKKYLQQVGNGTVSAAPSWQQISPSDLSSGAYSNGTFDCTSNLGMVRLADTVLAASATNITFSSITGTCKHLTLMIQARTDVAGTIDNLQLQFNGDTAADYDFQSVNGNNATANASNSSGATSLQLCAVPGSTATRANSAGSCTIDVPNYSGTTFEKSEDARGGADDSTAANSFVGLKHGSWRSTAAITSIKIFPQAGTNLVTGTHITLYGSN